MTLARPETGGKHRSGPVRGSVRGSVQHSSPLPPPDLDVVAQYCPKLPHDVWDAIGPFVRSAVTDCSERVRPSARRLMIITTALASWAHLQGMPLERGAVFGRNTVALFVERGCGEMTRASRGTYRSTLLGMGAVLAPDRHAPRLPRLAATPAAAPYTRAELSALRSWARGGLTAYRRENSAILLALGVGAGLVRAEMTDLLVRHLVVDSGGALVEVVGGRHPRAVPVLREWEEALADAASSGRDPDEHLLLPRARKSRGHIVADAGSGHSLGAPSSPRMRSTWIVRHLAAGVPPRVLLEAAGVESLEAFDRFVQFVPDPDMDAARPLLRGDGGR